MKKDNEHTEEHKETNKKKIKVGSKEKLLLFDNEEFNFEDKDFFIAEAELESIIENIFESEIEDLTDKPLYEGWLDEAEYPQGFDIETFKSLSSFKKRVQYARDHLSRIGAGSSRIVFGVDPDTVVKIALNRKGLAQNRIEADVSNMGYDIIADVKEFDNEGFLYVEMERAKKLKKSDWKRLTGWSFEDWMSVLHNKMNDIKGRRGFRFNVPEDFEEIEESELFDDVLRLLMDFNMPPGDIRRVSSWGIVNRDGKPTPVLVDYGLTDDVLKDYYL